MASLTATLATPLSAAQLQKLSVRTTSLPTAATPALGPQDTWTPSHGWKDAVQAVGSGLVAGAMIAGPALLSRAFGPVVGIEGGFLGDEVAVMLNTRDAIDEDYEGGLLFGMGAIAVISGIAGATGWIGTGIATAVGLGVGIEHGIQVWRGKDEPLIGPR